MKIIEQAYAQTQSWSDINSACVSADGVATIQGVGCMLANVMSVVLTLLGIAGFIMIIYAAFNMMIMGGNSQTVEKSKNTITMAIVGIILALSSFIIVNIISSFTGVDLIKDFSIPGSGKNWSDTAITPAPTIPSTGAPFN